MSFTTDVKNEISSLEYPKSEILAELSAFIKTSSKFNEQSINIMTENAKVARRIYKALKNIYGINSVIEEKKSPIFNKMRIYSIDVKDKANTILKDLSIIDLQGQVLDNPKDYILDSTEEVKGYLRGMFLAKGSVNDPKTSMYHLEFLFENKFEAVLVQRLLNQFDLNSKILLRDKKYMVYMKESEKISDFLKIINAYKAVLYYENVRVLKDKKNATNRLNNCEQANMDRVISTSNKQLEDIQLIEEKIGFDFLDDKLKEACIYRKKYPETSLVELSEIISLETNNKITKSGLNHRFRKLKEMANRIKNNEN